ncbi:MAG: hypothetical protein R6U96_11370 [Promethearchaeia archaeon]
MYLFKDQEEVEVEVSCKMCLKDVKFTFTADEYKNTKEFPLIREDIHGKPEHKLIVFFNKQLEVENFELEDVLEEKEISFSEELTRQVLSDIDLTDEEIELYFRTTGRDAVSLGELAILLNKTKDEAQKVAQKFVDKGLFKTIVGATPHYSALPPYAAIVSQLRTFHEFIANIKQKAPKELNKSFKELESKTEGVKRLKDYSEFMVDLKENALERLYSQKKVFESNVDKIDQIREMSDIISNIEEDSTEIMNTQIQKVENQFESISTKIEESVEGQINDLKKNFDSLNDEISESMQAQLGEMTDQFEDVNEKIYRTMKSQITDLTSDFEGINERISSTLNKEIKELRGQFEAIQGNISQNLKKLRLGVLQQTVNKVIDKTFKKGMKKTTEKLNRQLNEIQSVFEESLEKSSKSLIGILNEFQEVSDDGLKKAKIGFNKQLSEFQKISSNAVTKTTIGLKKQLDMIQKVSSEGLERTTEEFNTEVTTKLQSSIGDSLENINEIAESSAKSGKEIKEIFAEISKKFSQAVLMAEKKLSGISNQIFDSFDSLRNTFSNKIISTLDDILGEILERLGQSEITVSEFWEKAKEKSGVTMKDIWFIRSIEGAKAHIKDQISKAKMRILIVAPELTDIDIEPIKERPRHINTRIATFIDPSREEHSKILHEFDEMPNVSYRHRELQNLWGINRDYEEVVLSIVSKTEVEGETITEIAGIGSIIQEHIKIFVPILEDAWVGAKKDMVHTVQTSTARQGPKPSAISQQQKTQGAPKTQPAPETTNKPVSSSSLPEPGSGPAQAPKSEEELPEPKPASTSTSTKETAPEPSPESSEPQADAVIEKTEFTSDMDINTYLSNEFERILNNLGSMTGIEISKNLTQLQNEITEHKGYSSVLKQIKLSSNTQKTNPNKLSDAELQQLQNKMKFWKQKLHL